MCHLNTVRSLYSLGLHLQMLFHLGPSQSWLCHCPASSSYLYLKPSPRPPRPPALASSYPTPGFHDQSSSSLIELRGKADYLQSFLGSDLLPYSSCLDVNKIGKYFIHYYVVFI